MPPSASTMKSHFCCAAPDRSGMSSPVPPYRPPTFSNINDPLFALASLPADHPHAPVTTMRMPRVSFGEKVSEGEILKSPKVWMKMGLGKKKSRGHVREEEVGEEEVGDEGWYDEDARVLGSREAVVQGEGVEVPPRASSKG